MIGTAIATVTALVFCMAMGANSTPAQLHTLKLWMAGLSCLGIGGIIIGVLLLRAGLPGWAAGASFAPVIVICLLLGIALLK